jgi:hypothetical protein
MQMRDMSYYNSFWYRFTLPIKRTWFKFLLSQDKLIKVDERHRGVGKTYMMIEKAIKYDIPILAGTQRHVDLIKRSANVVDVYGFAKNFTIHIKGKTFPNGVLIDESVDPEMLAELRANNIRIRGGFIPNYRSDNNEG